MTTLATGSEQARDRSISNAVNIMRLDSNSAIPLGSLLISDEAKDERLRSLDFIAEQIDVFSDVVMQRNCLRCIASKEGAAEQMHVLAITTDSERQ